MSFLPKNQTNAPRSPSAPEPHPSRCPGAAGDGTWHAEETARHRELGCLRKVGKHGAGRGGDATLQSALGLRSLRKKRTKTVGRHQDRPSGLEAVADAAAARVGRINGDFWPVRGKCSLQIPPGGVLGSRVWAVLGFSLLDGGIRGEGWERRPAAATGSMVGIRGEGWETSSSYGLRWGEEMGCGGLGVKVPRKKGTPPYSPQQKGRPEPRAAAGGEGAGCSHLPPPRASCPPHAEVTGCRPFPIAGAREEAAPLTCRSVWCRMMFSCLLTLETAGAVVGDKAACCCSLCSIS